MPCYLLLTLISYTYFLLLRRASCTSTPSRGLTSARDPSRRRCACIYACYVHRHALCAWHLRGAGVHAYIGSTARTPSYLDTYKEDLPKYCLSLSLVLCVCVCVCARACVCVCAYVASRSFLLCMVCTYYEHLGVQVPPAARADMEAFKEHSLYPHIHARQAEDYQACAYHLLPTCSHLLPRVLTHLLLTIMRTCTYSCMLYSYSQTQADVSLTATRRVRSSRERAYLPTNLLTY